MDMTFMSVGHGTSLSRSFISSTRRVLAGGFHTFRSISLCGHDVHKIGNHDDDPSSSGQNRSLFRKAWTFTSRGTK